MMAYEKKVDDYSFGTMLRSSPKEEYTQHGTIFGKSAGNAAAPAPAPSPAPRATRHAHPRVAQTQLYRPLGMPPSLPAWLKGGEGEVIPFR